MKKSRVVINQSEMREAITASSIELKTQLLIDYAKRTIQAIGWAIQSRGGAHGMDRTGNLLNSLCWGVSYRGELRGSGFYREANSTRVSQLHEWSKYADAYPVYGHMFAQEYIEKYGGGGGSFTEGWRVFFAILAPYWGYWEEGFTLKPRKGRARRMRFMVMTKFYDRVAKDLKPTNIRFKVHVAEYTQESMSKHYESYMPNKNRPYLKSWQGVSYRRRK